MTYSTQKNNIYYVLDNCCPDIESAVEVQELYQAAGVAVDILTEQEYFENLEKVLQ